MASRQKNKQRNRKNRLKRLRKGASIGKKKNDSLINKGEAIFLQMIETDAPVELTESVSQAIDWARRGESTLLQQIVEMAEEEREIFDQPVEIEFPFSTKKAADLLHLACGEMHQRKTLELTRKAFEIDPESIDAMVLLGDFSRENGECLDWYQKASVKLTDRYREPKTDLEHPVAACRYHMGNQLLERMLFADAFEIMAPVLEFRPDTVRMEMLQIALMLEWHDELYMVLGKGEQLNGFDDYVEAIAAFQIHGDSEVSRRLLQRGYKLLPEAAKYLTGQVALPGDVPVDVDTSLALAVARCVLPAARSKTGLVKWIRNTLDLKVASREFDDSLLESFENPPQTSDVWEFHIVKQKGKTHLLCLDEHAPVHMEILEHSPSDRERAEFLKHCIHHPAVGEARIPFEVQFDTKKSQASCRRLLKKLNINSCVLKQDLFSKAALKSAVAQITEVIRLAETTSSNIVVDSHEVKSIPISPDIAWVVSIHRTPIWITDRATPRRFWNIHVFDANSGMIVGLPQLETKPTAENVFDELGNMMLQSNPPVKPECLLIEPRTNPDLFSKLSPIVRCEVGNESVSETVLESISHMVTKVSQCRPAIDSVDDITDEDMRVYYEAAARFYKQTPWRLVTGDQIIGVRSLDNPDEQWGVAVIGQMGETLGLSIVEGIENAVEMSRETISAMDLNLISVQFGEDFDMVPSDLLLMEWRARELANDDAFPLFMKVKPSIRDFLCPSEHELRMVTMLLNVIPAFLKSNGGAAEKVIKETSAGRQYSLSFER